MEHNLSDKELDELLCDLKPGRGVSILHNAWHICGANLISSLIIRIVIHFLSPVRLCDRILLSPYTKYVIPTILVALTVPFAVYWIMIGSLVRHDSLIEFSIYTCHIYPSYYVDCMPGRTPTSEECERIGCCWSGTLGVCFHAVPSQHGYFSYNSTYFTALNARREYSPLGSRNVGTLQLEIQTVDNNHLRITLYTAKVGSERQRRRRRSWRSDAIAGDGSSSEGSPIVRRKNSAEETGNDHGTGEIKENEPSKILFDFLPRDRRRRTFKVDLDKESKLEAYVHYPEFSVTVTRANSSKSPNKDEKTNVLSTARGPLVVTETYWEWTLYMTNGSLFGLNYAELNGTTNWIYNNENGTVRPAFLGISETGEGISCYVDYEGPLEVEVLNGSNLLILRGLSSPEEISVHVFAGPTPLEAIRQLATVIPRKSMPSIGSYGLHVCPRDGNAVSVEEAAAALEDTLKTTRSMEAPWDSHCLSQAFSPTLERELSDDDSEWLTRAREILKREGKEFAPHLSPMLPSSGTLRSTLESKSLLLTKDSGVYVGLYEDEEVVFADWIDPQTAVLAREYLANYTSHFGASGFVFLRDSWPKDQSGASSNSTFEGFDYMPEEMKTRMTNRTIPHDLSSASTYSHHVTHNSYSKEFDSFVRSSLSTVELQGLPGEAGNTSWSALRLDVRVGVGSGVTGQLPPPMYVCGTGNHIAYDIDELCTRWYGAAVVWPNILVLPERLPGGSYVSTSASLNAAKLLRFRASLSTYQHTVLADHLNDGSPILAPTSVYYPTDRHVRYRWDQFMWGDGILVGLVTLPEVSQVAMWLPGELPWRHIRGGAEVNPSKASVSVTSSVGQIVALVRPGHVIPYHERVEMTTEKTMSGGITLIANLACTGECLAFGKIFYGRDAGEYLVVGVGNTSFTLENIIRVQNYSCAATSIQSTIISSVELLGIDVFDQLEPVDLCNLTEDSVEVNFS